MTAPLTHDWTIIASAEGGEVLARLDDSREGYIRVSYPEDLREDFLIEALRDKGVEVNLGVQPFYQPGESPDEAVALFKMAASKSVETRIPHELYNREEETVEAVEYITPAMAKERNVGLSRLEEPYRWVPVDPLLD